MLIKLLPEFHEVKPHLFVLKLGIFTALVTICILAILRAPGLWVLPAQFALGVLFAHAVELQHQCLHRTAFGQPKLDRFFGVILGLPMLVSYSHYRATHLRHHKLLGTPRNKEFFSYVRESFRSYFALLRQAYSLRRYATVAQQMKAAILGQACGDADNSREASNIRLEYRLAATLITAVVSGSVYFQSLLVVELWIAPLVLSAEAAHYLIELPEHVGCDTTTRNIGKNTRTIRGSWWSFWLTNGNNFHAEHHWDPTIPNNWLPEVHPYVKPQLTVYETSYWVFYSGLVQSAKGQG